jgi:long-chain acyl-CoA synthetase
LLKAWLMHLSGTGQRASNTLSYVAVGGARVERDLLTRAREAGIPAYQGYGLTECGSVVCLNRPGDDGDGVGRPLDHVHIYWCKGEILAGTNAFLGYLEEPPSEPGAPFATGDLGQIDERGHVHLSGRRKNLLITSFGRNVSPEWVEAALLAQTAIAQAIVIGEAQASLSAFIVPAPQANREAICAAVERANQNLPDYARIGKWTLTVPFTLQNGLATGNGRPVRAAILNHLAGELANPAPNSETKEITHAFL